MGERITRLGVGTKVHADHLLTMEGLRKLEGELEHLKCVKRRKIAQKIRDALLTGDSWENPEYEAAKDEQASLESRIASIEATLRNAVVIDETTGPNDVVRVGSRVRLRDLDTNEEFEYLIVGSAEADPLNNRISYQSPVARAILNKKCGDTAEVEAPVGNLKFAIIEIVQRAVDDSVGLRYTRNCSEAGMRDGRGIRANPSTSGGE